MTVPNKVVLHIWEGDFGLPTVDPDCLMLLTLFKIYRIKVSIRYASLPYWCAIPSLELDNVRYTKFPEVVSSALLLCKVEFERDVVLQGQIIIYKNYFLECFSPAFFIDCWIQEANFQHVTKTWFQKVIPFPFNYLYLKKNREKARERFEDMLEEHTSYTCIVKHYEKAGRCLEDLSIMLNDGRLYLLGKTPTSLDALVYSYLVVTLNSPLPDPTLQNIIKSHSNLARFIRNMTQRYYPNSTVKYKYVQPVNVSSERATMKSIFLAALCASTAMFMYAYVNGLIKPKIPRLKFF